MFGKNIIVKKQKEKDYNGTIGIVEIFETLQGEGPFSGTPAVFIRTKDCSLACSFCDTNFSEGENMWIYDIIDEVGRIALPNHNGKRLVVITGGEPLIWFGITDLIDSLLDKGYAVQIETCGAIYNSELPWLNAFFFVVCSPKTPKLNANIEMNADAFKYIITDGEVSEEDGLPNKSTQIKGKDCILARPPESVPVYLTPCDPHEDDAAYKANTDQAIDSCKKFGYTLNLQLHKVVGLP